MDWIKIQRTYIRCDIIKKICVICYDEQKKYIVAIYQDDDFTSFYYDTLEEAEAEAMRIIDILTKQEQQPNQCD